MSDLELYKKKIFPMLAVIGRKTDLKLKNFIYEPKLDGTRCILYKSNNNIRMLNRRGNWFQHRFPEIVEEAKKLFGDVILDGEVIVLDKNGLPNFSLLQSRDQTENAFKIKLLSTRWPATLYVFDILAHDNNNLTKQKLIDRKHVLEKVIPDNLIHIRKVFYLEGQGLRLWRDVKKFNMEGVMAKDRNSIYLVGIRSRHWLKIKNIKVADCIICGYTVGIRSPFASLVLGQYYRGKLLHVGQVGTGFDSKQVEELGKALKKIKTSHPPFSEVPKLTKEVIWVRPKYVAEVQFLNYTNRLHLRAPSFKRLRFDKPIKACIIEKL
ncbi:MAG: non-homologous end-joining DNA ligase [Candidatus Nanoarchaeia archaeon]